MPRKIEGSEAEQMTQAQARAAAGFDDTLAAVDGRRAVITVMAGDIVVQ